MKTYIVAFRDGKTKNVLGHSLAIDSSGNAFLVKDEEGETLLLLTANAVTSIEWREGSLKNNSTRT